MWQKRFAVLLSLVPGLAYAAMPITSPWMHGDSFATAHACGGSYYHENLHTGSSSYAIDFNRAGCAQDLGYPLLAVADGTVVQAEWNSSGFGYLMKIDHGIHDGKDVVSMVAHCQEDYPFAAVLGEEVKEGQVIGYIGGTPNYSSHLHFELRENSSSVLVSSMDGYNFCDDASCNSHLQTSENNNISEQEVASNGGSATFGSMQANTHWYHTYDAGDLYRTGHVPNNCYVQNWGGGPYSNCGVVYDALGGARRAYTVRTGFWQNSQDPPNGWANQGGPTSPLGMPITNEYATDPGYVARQDFTLGWLNFNAGANVVTVHSWNVCAPGWGGQDGWLPQVSYRIADVYAANGAVNYYGQPTASVYHDANGWHQNFQNHGPITIPDAYQIGGQGGPPPVTALPFDFDGDGLSDAWDRTSTGLFHIDFCDDGLYGWEWTGQQYGGTQDTPCPADYDGDGICDIAILRSSDRKYLIDVASNNLGWFDITNLIGYGGYGDIPLPADYDGDGSADIAVRDADGDWHVDYSSNGLGSWDVNEGGYGGAYDTPCTGDFNGDGHADIAILRNSDRKFFIDYWAADGFKGYDVVNLGGYGGYGDTPCPADYDHDGTDDVSVRDADGDWHIDYHANGFGAWDWTGYGYGSTPNPTRPGDYDGDGFIDFGVYFAPEEQLCFDRLPYGAWDACDGGHPSWKQPGDPTAPEPDGPTITLQREDRKPVTVEIYDVSGRLITSHVRVDVPGSLLLARRIVHERSLPGGIYFVRLLGPSGRTTQKLLVLR